MSVYVWPALLFTWLFFMGASIGSFLNVCIARLPTRRTPCWPGSHCFGCFQPVGLRDNIPLLSYWLLGGRCRVCHAPFTMRYFWIELATGCLFAGYYLLDIGFNVHQYQTFGQWGFWYIQAALFPPWSWALFIVHALMLAFLLTAAMIQWEQGRPERSVVVRGCFAGLIVSMSFSWPFPYGWPQAVALGESPSLAPATRTGLDLGWFTPHPGPMPADSSWSASFYSPRLGFTPWPIFGPLPNWLTWGPALGLATGLAGCSLGLALRSICCGGFGLSDGRAENRYDDGGVLAIAGSFLGWQPILIGSALAFSVALLWRYAVRRPPLPFGLVAGVAVLVPWLAWTWLTSLLAPVCFDLMRSVIALAIVGMMGVGLHWSAAKDRIARRQQIDQAAVGPVTP